MFALDALVEAYPNARFLWSHRDPVKVLGSVCSLIHYTRSWSSDREDSVELGAEQLGRWWVAVERAMDFRARMGDDRFADVSFAELQTDPLDALEKGLARIGLPFDDASRTSVATWAGGHEPGAHGSHAYQLSDFGLEPDQIRERFAPYYAAFGIDS
jgi:hypothetical protein